MTAPEPHRPRLVDDPAGPGPEAPDPRPTQARRAARRARRAAWRAQFTSALPMRVALAGVASVWAVGGVWSFTEQTAFAVAKGFAHPALLPLAIDGFAVSAAGVAFAASLDGRPAVFARLMTVVGIALSATFNGVWAAQRSAAPQGPDVTAVAVGVVVPLVAYVALEVFLRELRRRVQRSRGMPPPVALPPLRLIRLVLDFEGTFTDWRREVLDRTATTPTARVRDEGPRLVPDTSESLSELPSLEEAAATLFEIAPTVSRDRLQKITRCNTYQAKRLHAARPGVAQ